MDVYEPCQHLQMPRDETRIWRFLSLPKFLSLLNERVLHFARLDTLGDEHEGTVPSHSPRSRPEFAAVRFSDGREVLLETSQDPIYRDAKAKRDRTWASCWYADHQESDGMWKLYGGDKAAVAVQSTVGRLKAVIAEDRSRVKLGLVEYEEQTTPSSAPRLLPSYFVCYYRKRWCFKHEQEFRALITDALEGTNESASPPMRAIPVDVGVLVERVIAAPGAQAWQLELLRSVGSKLGLACPVEPSLIDRPPLY